MSFELLVQEDPALLQEFLDPPTAADLGKSGQLVFVVGFRRKVCRVNLDDVVPGRAVELEGTGLKFTLRRRGQLMDLLGEKLEEGAVGRPMPLYPAVEFNLSGFGGTATYVTCARLPHFRALREGQEIERFSVWYHYPDFRWGEKHRMGSLQFLKGPGGKVYYRVYGKDGLRQKGVLLDTDDPRAVHELPWKRRTATIPQTAARAPASGPSTITPASCTAAATVKASWSTASSSTTPRGRRTASARIEAAAKRASVVSAACIRCVSDRERVRLSVAGAGLD